MRGSARGRRQRPAAAPYGACVVNQTVPPGATAIPSGLFPISTVETIVFEAGSIFTIVPPIAFVTQTEPAPTAIAFAPDPVSIESSIAPVSHRPRCSS